MVKQLQVNPPSSLAHYDMTKTSTDKPVGGYAVKYMRQVGRIETNYYQK